VNPSRLATPELDLGWNLEAILGIVFFVGIALILIREGRRLWRTD
jgi:hypothetical protein